MKSSSLDSQKMAMQLMMRRSLGRVLELRLRIRWFWPIVSFSTGLLFLFVSSRYVFRLSYPTSYLTSSSFRSQRLFIPLPPHNHRRPGVLLLQSPTPNNPSLRNRLLLHPRRRLFLTQVQ